MKSFITVVFVLFLFVALSLAQKRDLKQHSNIVADGVSEKSDVNGWCQVRFINLVTTSGYYQNVDVYANNVPFLRSVSYKSFSSYTLIPSGSFDILVTFAGNTTEISNKNVLLYANQNYTIILYGSYEQSEYFPIRLSLLVDNNTVPTTSSTYYVRVVDVSVGYPELRIANMLSTYSNATTLFDRVTYGTVTPYINITGGSYVKAFLSNLGSFVRQTNITVFNPASVGSSSYYYRGVATIWITGQFGVSYTPASMTISTDYQVYGYVTEEEKKKLMQEFRGEKKVVKRNGRSNVGRRNSQKRLQE